MKIESNKKTRKERELKSNENYENILEPENFHILTNYNDDFIIDSKEDAKALLENLKNSKYNEKLAKFILNFKLM